MNTLLVEDEPGIRAMLTQVLARRDHTVTACADAETAWGLVQEQAFPLILLDWRLPGMDGLELCRRLRTLPHGAHSHILLLTAYVQQVDMHRALAAGADDYLAKPFDLEVLQVRLAIAERDVAAAAALRASAQRFRTLAETAPVGISIVDAQGRFELVNAAAAALVGYTPAELVGQRFSVLVGEQQGSALRAASWLWGADQRASQRDYDLRTKQGETVTVLATSSALPGVEGRPGRVVFTVDVTERREEERRVAYQAHYEQLPGRPPRTLFGEVVEQALARARRQTQIIALLFVDLDGFKEVNDTWGHAVGDGVLQEVARCLRQSIRASDSVARLAGDEFVIVLPDIGAGAHAADVARKILDALSHGCAVEGRQLALTASIGISLYPFAGHTLDTLLKSADRAMYGAKRRGKNTYAFFTEGNRDAGAP